jgi:hypothetical protein
LDSDRNEGRSLKEIATEIVDGFHEFLQGSVKKPATPLRVGMLIKGPYDAKVRRVAWIDDAAGKVWIIHETSSYGWLGPISPATWEYCEEFRTKKRIPNGEGPDGKPKFKMVEMTDAEIDEAWSNPDYQVGDLFSQHQREHVLEVIATGPACVLMRDVKSGILNVDSNKNLIHYYKREIKGSGEW